MHERKYIDNVHWTKDNTYRRAKSMGSRLKSNDSIWILRTAWWNESDPLDKRVPSSALDTVSLTRSRNWRGCSGHVDDSSVSPVLASASVFVLWLLPLIVASWVFLSPALVSSGGVITVTGVVGSCPGPEANAGSDVAVGSVLVSPVGTFPVSVKLGSAGQPDAASLDSVTSAILES